MMAGIVQKKLKSYVSIVVPFEKWKRKNSVDESVVEMIKKLWKED